MLSVEFVTLMPSRLAWRAGPCLPPELCAKVLVVVRAACAKPRSNQTERLGRIGFGRFVAAAAVVLWLNLAMRAAEYSPWPAAMGPSQDQAKSEELRELLSELDEPSAGMWAWRMRTGCNHVPAPRVPPQGAKHSSGALDKLGTVVPWDMH